MNLAASQDGSLTRIVADGQGGTVAVWINRAGTDVSAAYVNEQEAVNSLWPPTSLGIPSPGATDRFTALAIAADVNGTVYVVVGSQLGKVYLQTIVSTDATLGTPLLLATNAEPGSGLAIAASNYPGAAMVAWRASMTASAPSSPLKIIVREVTGEPLTAGPVLVVGDRPNWVQQNCQVISDGNGGYIVAWEEYSGALASRVYAQRLGHYQPLDPLTRMWTAASNYGLPMTATAPPVDDGAQMNPQIILIPGHSNGVLGNVTHPNGRVCVVWEDFRKNDGDDVNKDLYAQSIDLYGVRWWQPQGTPICTSTQPQRSVALAVDYNAVSRADASPTVYSDVFITWQDNSDGTYQLPAWQRRAQRIDRIGDVKWPVNGVLVTDKAGTNGYPTALPETPTIVSIDGQAVVTSACYRDAMPVRQLWAQKLAHDGSVVWSMPLSTNAGGDKTSEQSALIAIGASSDYLIVSDWIDTRAGGPNDSSVYVQAMRWCDGEVDITLPTSSDVRIKRRDDDEGDEPLSVGPFASYPWNAPDIWNTVLDTYGNPVDPSDPGMLLHHDPIYKPVADPNDPIPFYNILNVKLRNSGCDWATGGTLSVYISTFNTGAPWLTPVSATTMNGDWEKIGEAQIGAIASGGAVVTQFPWTPAAGGHYCFYTRFDSNDDPMSPEGSSVIDNVVADNNLGHRNVDIIDSTEQPGSVFIVYNHGDISRELELRFDLGRHTGPATLATPDINLRLPQDLFRSWQRAEGPARSRGIRVNADSSITLIDTAHAVIARLPFGPRSKAAIAYHLDSYSRLVDENMLVQVAQYTLGDSAIARIDGGLTWDIRSIKPQSPVTGGGDTVGPDKRTPRPAHVQTFALFVGNNNTGKRRIDRIIIGVTGGATILAVGPLQNQVQASVSMGRDATGRPFVFDCAQDAQTRLYADETFRPIYLTVARQNLGALALTFVTLDGTGDTISVGTVSVDDPLTTSAIRSDDNGTVALRSSLIDCYPNPATSTGTARFLLPSIVKGADVVLTDATGRTLRTLAGGETLSAGLHEITFDVSDLPAGAYFVSLRVDGSTYSGSLRVVR